MLDFRMTTRSGHVSQRSVPVEVASLRALPACSRQLARWLFFSLGLGLLLSQPATVSTAAEPTLVWPQFRGPGGSGIAEGQKPPIEMGPEKNLKWKTSIPSGYSSPIIVGKLLVLTAFDDGKLYTIAYTRTDGKEAWRAHAPATQIEPFHKTESSPAASTPVTDGTRIVSYFGSCGLFCYDLGGNELWRYKLPPAATPFDFGSGVSPVLADGLVILVRDEQKDPKIVAIDLATGKQKWETKRESKSSFCSPVVCDTPRGRQVVTPGYQRMIGYDLSTGTEQWTVKGMPAAACTTPVAIDGTLFFAGWSPGEDFQLPKFDDLLKEAGDEAKGYITREGCDRTGMKGMFDSQDFNHDEKLTRDEWEEAIRIVSASRNSAFALKLGGSGDVTETHVLWTQKSGLPYVPSGIVYDGQFILVKDGGIITIYDAKTGKRTFQQRAIANGRYYASPVAANGHIYFTSLDDGVITVTRPAGKSLQVVSTNPSLGERIAATPVIADDCLYVRSAGTLWAFGE